MIVSRIFFFCFSCFYYYHYYSRRLSFILRLFSSTRFLSSVRPWEFLFMFYYFVFCPFLFFFLRPVIRFLNLRFFFHLVLLFVPAGFFILFFVSSRHSLSLSSCFLISISFAFSPPFLIFRLLFLLPSLPSFFFPSLFSFYCLLSFVRPEREKRKTEEREKSKKEVQKRKN